MYPGYTAESVKNLLDSPVVKAKVRELCEARLTQLNLPPEVDRAARLKSLEKQMRGVVAEIADGLVAKMDSKPFLQFFGASVNVLLARMYDQGAHMEFGPAGYVPPD